MKSKSRNQLSQVFKSLRKQMGITQKQLSSETGVNIKVIRSIEQGYSNVTLSRLEELLSYFGFSLIAVDRKKLSATHKFLDEYKVASRSRY